MITTTNPATGKEIKSYETLTNEEIQDKLAIGQEAFQSWKKLSYAERAEYLMKVAQILKNESEEYGKIITEEMGKPLHEATGEVAKCAWVCEHYAEKGEEYLQKEYVETEAKKSYMQFDPIGIILEVMPWNFPFWQAFRVSAPTLMAGNVIVLKHASNVPGSALAIEEIFRKAGVPEGVFQTLIISSSQVEGVLSDDRVQAVSLTGSEYAGSQVASIAGREIKKSVMELGGTDPFIVMPDADMDAAINTCMIAKYLNGGQVCISAKRLVLHKDIAEEFMTKFIERTKGMTIGDPMNKDTKIGPISSEKAWNEIHEQVQANVNAGAELVLGGKKIDGEGFFYESTILSGITKDMPGYYEEIFGPVSLVFIVDSEDEAIKLANDSRYGLGASVWTQDEELIEKFTNEIEAGSVFVNEMVKTDPRISVGGIKKSGYGREIGEYGIKEFTNIKAVWIK